ncbi:serine acetyltransferase [Pseudoalteromonas sp. MMG010]|uniref:serine O-acetyltransferase n=1 Tax=Pseudoalteromonas sp. MMG010 TaxID=2822685 RepID=UPI001B39D95A|nr:serine O-acetyltransferase [Pseudoalteromonas sp. MMG010]MBQ4834146.1 serine acetyltransferase [Pseudoalteromonas sp. MMG010]
MTPFQLIKADLFRYTAQYSFSALIKNLLNSNCGFKYMFWFRLCLSKNYIVRFTAQFMHRHLSIKYQIQIPKETKIGPGLYLGHATSIVINSTAVIGKNCNLSQFTTIGSNYGQAAVIGDNVYIGPNVCVVEHVLIGNCAAIGAGSVVVKNVLDNCTVVGNPARVISDKQEGIFIVNPFEGDH